MNTIFSTTGRAPPAPTRTQETEARVHNWKSRAAKITAVALPFLLMAAVAAASILVPAALGLASGGFAVVFGRILITSALVQGASSVGKRLQACLEKWAESLKSTSPLPTKRNWGKGHSMLE